jgi:hypothetical protein
VNSWYQLQLGNALSVSHYFISISAHSQQNKSINLPPPLKSVLFLN